MAFQEVLSLFRSDTGWPVSDQATGSIEPEVVSCGNCQAACCRKHAIMALHADEVSFMEDAGTVLHEKESPIDNTDKGRGIYKLETDCGHLVKEDGWLKCAAYDSPSHPKTCSRFVVGRETCLSFRYIYGVDP